MTTERETLDEQILKALDMSPADYVTEALAQYKQVGWGYVDKHGFTRLQLTEPHHHAVKFPVFARKQDLPEPDDEVGEGT